jgi:hypothetical protein
MPEGFLMWDAITITQGAVQFLGTCKNQAAVTPRKEILAELAVTYYASGTSKWHKVFLPIFNKRFWKCGKRRLFRY